MPAPVPFVYAPISLTGKLLKSYADEFHPAPEADLVLGPNPEDWNYSDWTQDRHGQIRKGGILKSLGRYLYELHDVTVVNAGRLYLMLAPGIVCAEATPSAGLKLPENAELQVDTPQGRIPVNLMPAYEVHHHEKRPVVLYAHDWAGNLFHHYMDSLPRRWAADEGLLPPDVIEATAKPGAVHYDMLYFPSFWPVTGYSPTTVEWLRARAPPPAAWKRKRGALYFSRSDARTRRVTNEDAVIRTIADHGWRVRELCGAALSPLEQIRAVQDASLIIGPHGAAMMNTVFTEGASVIEFAPESRQPCCYQYLAKWAGNFYARLICPDGENQDMAVDLAMLSEALKAASPR